MRRAMTLALILLVALALPVVAQEEMGDDAGKMDEMDMEAMMTPPPPLDDEWTAWLVGHWEGIATGPMGESKEVHSYEMGLDGQFLMMEVKSQMGDRAFKGMGAVTQDQDGNLVGYWIDNFRSMSEGKGNREGNKQTMVWTTPMGTYTRVTERIDSDNFKVTARMEMANGQMMDEAATFTRVKMSDK